MTDIKMMTMTAVLLMTVACGKKNVLGQEEEYTIGGNISGLVGTLVLSNNGGDDLTLVTNSKFTFSTKIADDQSYSVTIKTQPSGQNCTISSGSGTVSGADVGNIAVICANGSAIRLFSAGAHNGNLGGRSGADAKCASAASTQGLTCSSGVHALISVDSNDEIRDMPANYGVPTNVQIQAVNGTVIQNSWAALLSDTLLRSLKSAGVTSGDYWWAGSDDSNGSLSANHCSNWTTAAGSPNSGRGGYSPSDSWTWIGSTLAYCSSTAMELVCLCY